MIYVLPFGRLSPLRAKRALRGRARGATETRTSGSASSPRWPMQPRCLRPGALPPPPTRLSPRYAIRTPSPRSCTLPRKPPSRCPCCCTYTAQASLGAVCGTSSLKARPARRLWSCTLAARSRRSPSSSVSSLRRRLPQRGAMQSQVVAPQTSAGWPAERVRAFMRFLLGAESPLPCRIDQCRCYVTGHSMGGSGALVSWA